MLVLQTVFIESAESIGSCMQNKVLHEPDMNHCLHCLVLLLKGAFWPGVSQMNLISINNGLNKGQISQIAQMEAC